MLKLIEIVVKQEPETPVDGAIEYEYSNVCEDFIEGNEVIDTSDDIFVNGINILNNTQEKK